MTTQSPAVPPPESIALLVETAPLRPVTPARTEREEVDLHLLARELVCFAPDLALWLRDEGRRRLRAELLEA